MKQLDVQQWLADIAGTISILKIKSLISVVWIRNL